MMRLRYTLTGAGWSGASLDYGEGEVAMSASYLSDALGALARCAIAVLRGSGEARFSFDEEPGEYRWVLKKEEADSYALTILEFRELWGNKPDSEGVVLIQRSIDRSEFGMMVLKALEDVRHEHGIDGYKQKWIEHDFPSDELSELRSLLGKRESNQPVEPTSHSAPRCDSRLT